MSKATSWNLNITGETKEICENQFLCDLVNSRWPIHARNLSQKRGWQQE